MIAHNVVAFYDHQQQQDEWQDDTQQVIDFLCYGQSDAYDLILVDGLESDLWLEQVGA
jgi:hypothetical protein